MKILSSSCRTQFLGIRRGRFSSAHGKKSEIIVSEDPLTYRLYSISSPARWCSVYKVGSLGLKRNPVERTCQFYSVISFIKLIHFVLSTCYFRSLLPAWVSVLIGVQMLAWTSSRCFAARDAIRHTFAPLADLLQFYHPLVWLLIKVREVT